MKELIEKAKIGEIVPVYKEVDSFSPVELFEKISDYGRIKNCLFFNFKDNVAGSADPCLKITGYKERFEISALNSRGVRILSFLKDDFKFCDKVQYSKNKLTGFLKPKKRQISEEQKFKAKGHMEVLRKIAFKFKPVVRQKKFYGGIFGAFSYDFVECVEECSNSDEKAAIYEFYMLDSLFIADRNANKTFFIANAYVTDARKNKLHDECMALIDGYEKALKRKSPKISSYKKKPSSVTFETSRDEFERQVQSIKKKIAEGEIYQAYLCRKAFSNYNADPFSIHKELIKRKPRWYEFFINGDNSIIFGSSPEMCLNVSGNEHKTAEVSLIARTKPTGLHDTQDKDIENRFEAEMKTDFKELFKHVMNIDAVRSDISRISVAGTRHLDKVFVAEKYPKEQNLVSSVKGEIKQGFDSFDAYLASMNRISGLPRHEAIGLLSQTEKSKRGFLFGTVCFISPDNCFEGAFIKNAMVIRNSKVETAVNTDITYDTIPEDEFRSTEEKFEVLIGTIRSAGGIE